MFPVFVCLIVARFSLDGTSETGKEARENGELIRFCQIWKKVINHSFLSIRMLGPSNHHTFHIVTSPFVFIGAVTCNHMKWMARSKFTYAVLRYDFLAQTQISHLCTHLQIQFGQTRGSQQRPLENWPWFLSRQTTMKGTSSVSLLGATDRNIAQELVHCLSFVKKNESTDRWTQRKISLYSRYLYLARSSTKEGPAIHYPLSTTWWYFSTLTTHYCILVILASEMKQVPGTVH